MPSPTTVTPWQRLYNDVKISVPGLIDAVFKQELFRCVKDFFDKTNMWVEYVPFAVTPNVLNYSVPVVGKGAPNRLLMVIDPKVSTNPANLRWAQGGISMFIPGEIALSQSVSSATNWTAIYAKNVVDPSDVDGYPDIDASYFWVPDKYRDCLTYGTLSRIQKQPSKTYSNPKGAAENYLQYVSERSKARTDFLKANTFDGQRWSFPQGYAMTAHRKGWV